MPNPSVNDKLISYNVVSWKDINSYFACIATSISWWNGSQDRFENMHIYFLMNFKIRPWSLPVQLLALPIIILTY